MAKRSSGKKDGKGRDELAELMRAQEKDRKAQANGKSELAKQDARDRVPADRRIGRHDTKQAPSGYTFHRGALFRRLVLQPGKRDVEAELLALSIVRTLLCKFYVAGPGGSPSQVVVMVDGLLRNASSDSTLAKLKPALTNAYKAIVGTDPKEPEWVGMLVSQLESNAHQIEEDRLRRETGWEPPSAAELAKLFAERGAAQLADLDEYGGPEEIGAIHHVANGRQILAYIRRRAEELADWYEERSGRKLTPSERGALLPPPALTPQAIDGMIGRIGVGAGGPRGTKTARGAADEWIRKNVNPAKPKRIRVRRNSKV